MEILDMAISETRKDYKCFSELKRLYHENSEFKNILEEGLLSGKIQGFDEELWNKIQNQNIRRINSFEDVFKEGANLGYCTVASKQLSYSLDSCFLCGGALPILKGTANCVDGSHTWISSHGKLIDTTLMLIMDETFSKHLGYIEENRYDPRFDPIYMVAKDYTNDQNLKTFKS